MRRIILFSILIIVGIAFVVLVLPRPDSVPGERYDDAEDRTVLTILANEYADRERTELIEQTRTARYLCGPYGLFPQYTNESGSCEYLLASGSYRFAGSTAGFEAGYVVFTTEEEASAQVNVTIAQMQEVLSERLVPNAEIENKNEIVRGQLGPDIDEARFFRASLSEENGSLYRTVSLLRTGSSVYFVVEDTEEPVKRYYYDAFSSEKHTRLLDIYNVSIIG